MKELFEMDNSSMSEEIKKVKAETAKSPSGGGRNIFKFEEGEEGNKIRILPPMKGMKTPWKHYKIHFNLMGSNGKQMAILCGLMDFDDCPLCREAALFREAGDKMKAWNASPRDQYAYNIINPEGEIALMMADKNLQIELVKKFEFLTSSAAAEEGWGHYPWDLEKGCWIKVTKTKGVKQGNQKFAPNIWSVDQLMPKPLEEKYLVKASEQLVDLNTLYKPFTPEELQDILDGKLDPFAKKNADAEPEEKPAPKSKSVSDRLKSVEKDIEEN
jgi:hypothetical protein